ncbi:hypothetical protein SUGI_0242680 [Cryptomeria japonica]|nr:hypothetical protein SUGI_0242680 [Cryptomeria japonica]
MAAKNVWVQLKNTPLWLWTQTPIENTAAHKQTAEKVSLPRYRGSSSPKAKLKNNPRISKKGNSMGKRRSGICDAQADVSSQEISNASGNDFLYTDSSIAPLKQTKTIWIPWLHQFLLMVA